MPELLPPKLAGVQQRLLYQRVRTVVTVLSILWLVFAVIGFGSFSGGTTSLALALVLLYGTVVALLVVIAAAYRGLRRFAAERIGAGNSAAAVVVDTARSAARELRMAFNPAPPSGRPVSPAQRPAGQPAQTAAADRLAQQRKTEQRKTQQHKTEQQRAQQQKHQQRRAS